MSSKFKTRSVLIVINTTIAEISQQLPSPTFLPGFVSSNILRHTKIRVQNKLRFLFAANDANIWSNDAQNENSNTKQNRSSNKPIIASRKMLDDVYFSHSLRANVVKTFNNYLFNMKILLRVAAASVFPNEFINSLLAIIKRRSPMDAHRFVDLLSWIEMKIC